MNWTRSISIQEAPKGKNYRLWMNNSYIIGNILPVSYYTNHWLFTLLIRSCPLFFTDKMNSILIFVGCGVIIVIVLVTCVILTTRCHLRIRPDHQGEAHMSSSNSSKQQLYHPYCIDTMTLVRQILPHMKSITIHVYVHVWSHPPKNSSYKCYGFYALDRKNHILQWNQTIKHCSWLFS